MTDSNKEVIMIVAKLVIISLVASALLGVTYVPTQKQLKINYELARQEALKEIMPDAANFEAVEGGIINDEGDREIYYYRAFDASGNPAGYAFFRQQAGAQGMIEVAGGVNANFEMLTGMTVMGHSETPGLGAKIVTPEFKNQFVNIAIADLSLSSAGGKIDSITGASISSQAVVDALNAKIEEVKEAEE
ncbi:MAG: RnfABCDGE type electron transport complex subunit G [Methanosarcinaceae archaeon]|nr:RnfABCDGE type electron transport complex subunit G [Methanosarcinaceae archaeon]